VTLHCFHFFLPSELSCPNSTFVLRPELFKSQMNGIPNPLSHERNSAFTGNFNDLTKRCVLMNRDGFTLLAMGFTGAKAVKFKRLYIGRNRLAAKPLKLVYVDSVKSRSFKSGSMACRLPNAAATLRLSANTSPS
jgi:hypothetical protein